MNTHSIGARTLGRSDLVVSALGLGCSGMSHIYGPVDEKEAIRTISRALELGVTLLDTSDAYGLPNAHYGHNEELLGKAVSGRRHEVVLATKVGVRPWDGEANVELQIDCSPTRIKSACESSLQRLGTDFIDLYYLHRVDPKIPIEDSVGAMVELVIQGKVRHLGLCEASARTLERAAGVHQIAALQAEWSLWTHDLEPEVLPMARRLGIGIVPFAPLGRGFFTGKIEPKEGFDESDFRNISPRITGKNAVKNLELVEHLRALGKLKGATPAQVALAWLLAQGDDVVPIPGSERREHVEENAGATHVALSSSELHHLSTLFGKDRVAGERYTWVSTYGDTPERPPQAAEAE
jgi:aryl-alcohol dehydrogenase-like predicted oxidoreductase